MSVSLKGFVMFQLQNDVEYAAGKLRHTEDLYLLLIYCKILVETSKIPSPELLLFTGLLRKHSTLFSAL